MCTCTAHNRVVSDVHSTILGSPICFKKGNKQKCCRKVLSWLLQPLHIQAVAHFSSLRVGDSDTHFLPPHPFRIPCRHRQPTQRRNKNCWNLHPHGLSMTYSQPLWHHLTGISFTLLCIGGARQQVKQTLQTRWRHIQPRISMQLLHSFVNNGVVININNVNVTRMM